jgi:hypothetical protein
LLTVSATLAESIIDIRVFHYDEPHVHIRLTRLEPQPTDARHAAISEDLCISAR